MRDQTELLKKLEDKEKTIRQLQAQIEGNKGAFPEIDIVSEEEAKSVIREVRIKIMVGEKEKKEFNFSGYSADDLVSIYEMSRMLKRHPYNLKGDTLKLARFLIESRENEKIKYNDFAECKFSELNNGLQSILGDCTELNEGAFLEITKVTYCLLLI